MVEGVGVLVAHQKHRMDILAGSERITRVYKTPNEYTKDERRVDAARSLSLLSARLYSAHLIAFQSRTT